ncbi:MAG: threonine synthase [Candidatus Acidiferrales bacterium]|jgi:threonine synthase
MKPAIDQAGRGAEAGAGAAAIAQLLCMESSCGARYGVEERLVVCARCGGLLEVELGTPPKSAATALPELWARRRMSDLPEDASGVWRFREMLPIDAQQPLVTLREGNTPLYEAPRAASYSGLDQLWLKHQGANPTGSFKDTGMTAAVTHAVHLGAKQLACASTGNTAASLAAYAARAGVRAVILVPRGQVSSAKLGQSMDYGAAVLELDGNFDAAMRVVRELAEDGSLYLVNSLNPMRVEGQKTVSLEIMEQRSWRVPDHVVVPGGNLGNISALGKGFIELRRWGLIDRLPRFTVVQAEGAAPFARLFAERARNPEAKIVPIENPRTLATAIRIGAPVSWRRGLRVLAETQGMVLTVTEQEIADAKAVIGRDGIGCEPASATTVAGIRRLVADGRIRKGESVVAVLTGHLLKDTDYTAKYHTGQLQEPPGAPGSGEQRPIAGAFANPPARVPATREGILDYLKRSSPEPRSQ